MVSFLSLTLTVFFFFNSCISFNWDSLKDQPAKNTQFKAPPPPYTPMPKKGMDAFWHNLENSGSISFFSNCFKHTEWTPLTQFQKEVLSELKGFRILKTEKTKYQNKPAHHLWLQSTPVRSLPRQQMELVLFKENNCFYVLVSLIAGKNNQFHKETFKNFVQGFQIL